LQLDSLSIAVAKKDKERAYPKEGAVKRVIWGSSFGLLGQIIGALRHVILVPLFLGAWGQSVYGEWLTIYALVSYLPLVNIGMQDYVVNLLTQSYTKADLKRYTKIFHSALRLYLAIVIFFLFAFLIFVFVAPFPDWLNIKSTNDNLVRVSTFMLGAYLLLGMPFGLIVGLYKSLGEYPRRVLFANFQRVLLLGLLALVLLLKGNFIFAAGVHLVVLLSLLLFVLYDIKHRHPEMDFGLSAADWRLSFTFIGPGLLFLSITLANALKIQGSVLVVSTSLGAGLVAVYCVHRTLANLVMSITGSIKNAVWPEMTAMEAGRNPEKLRLTYNLLVKLSLLMAFSFSVFLFFTGKNIIRVWTQGRIVFHPAFWIMLLAYLPLNCLWETSGIVQISTNNHKRFSLCRLSSSLLGLILAVILTKKWGIAGTLSGFIFAELAICWMIPLETLSIIRAKKLDFLLNTILRGYLVVIAQLVIGLLFYHFVSGTFIQCVLLAGAIGCVGLVMGYSFWLTQFEREKTLALTKAIFSRFKIR